MFASNTSPDQIDPELFRKANKTCDKLTETIYVAANEPTLACFRIQEHIHRTIPNLLDRKAEMGRNEAALKGILYDVEYTSDSIGSISRSREHFDSIQRLIKDSIHLKQQADYEESIRRRVRQKLTQQSESQPNRRPSPRSSASKLNRFSASFDLPTVASSMSADIKSLINQLTTTSKEPSADANRMSVPGSKSLYRLPENNPGDDGESIN